MDVILLDEARADLIVYDTASPPVSIVRVLSGYRDVTAILE